MNAEPTSADEFLQRAKAYNENNEYALAIADFDRAIALDPTNAKAFYLRGDCYDFGKFPELGEERFARIVADYSEAIRFDPTFIDARYARALEYAYNKNYTDADRIPDYDAIIALKPDEASAYQDRGGCYLRLGNLDQALIDYDTAIRLGPMPSTYLGRARTLAAMGRMDEAMSACDAAFVLDQNITIHPSRGAYVLWEKGELLYDAGRINESLAEFTRAIDLNTTDPDYSGCGSSDYWHSRAWAYHDLGDFEKALADANQAVRCNPDDWTNYHARANMNAALGNVQDAIHDYQAVLDLMPDHPEVEQEIAEYFVRWIKAK